MGKIIDNASASTPPVDDDVALAPAQLPVVADDTVELAPATEAASVEPTADVDVTDPVDEDDANLARLRALLADLRTQLSKKSTNPKDFAAAARLNSQVTKLLIHMPKVPMLDVYLTFLKQNADGVAKRERFMMGSTNLGSNDEREVGTLYGLFMDIVDGNLVPVSNLQIMQVLKKPEFGHYFARKVAVLAQQKRQAEL